MARPPAKELTERELEIMHVCWQHGKLTAGPNRPRPPLVPTPPDKGFLKQTTRTRPFVYRPRQSFDEVSRRIVGDLVDRVFRGSHTQLMVQLMESDRLSDQERR